MTSPIADRRLLRLFLLTAFASCAIAAASGFLASLSYTAFHGLVSSTGVTLQHLRPIHETFVVGWIYLAAAAVVYYFLLESFGPFSALTRKLVGAHLCLWVVAGLGIFFSVLAGSFSGREYIGFHPLFSLPILLGWLCFASIYFSHVGLSLKDKPAYLYMWSIALVLFVITFVEGHLYLLDSIGTNPLRDLAVQWKSYGPLVGSFNLLVYGSLMFVAERISGNRLYARSRLAFLLFYVGVLNTFTNFGHHTYHLPQTAWIHWISFVVSMLEIIILLKVLFDLLAIIRKAPSGRPHSASQLLIQLTTVWTSMLLCLSLLISVPPLNTLIHGTHVIVAHSMGSMLGIDSMALWACCSFLLLGLTRQEHVSAISARVRASVLLLSLSLFVFLCSFLTNGLLTGIEMYLGASSPDFSRILQFFPSVMACSGVVLAGSILWLLSLWTRLLLEHR